MITWARDIAGASIYLWAQLVRVGHRRRSKSFEEGPWGSLICFLAFLFIHSLQTIVSVEEIEPRSRPSYAYKLYMIQTTYYLQLQNACRDVMSCLSHCEK